MVGALLCISVSGFCLKHFCIVLGHIFVVLQCCVLSWLFSDCEFICYENMNPKSFSFSGFVCMLLFSDSESPRASLKWVCGIVAYLGIWSLLFLLVRSYIWKQNPNMCFCLIVPILWFCWYLCWVSSAVWILLLFVIHPISRRRLLCVVWKARVFNFMIFWVLIHFVHLVEVVILCAMLLYEAVFYLVMYLYDNFCSG